ncbi:MAG: molybdopterin molybdotransferase MoeA [Xanthomonadales bacterium]|nr:molybdopterin molybdotransferase MoeA [Gammaproteobacteria bacterium]MBT8053288.1 molybdopterin molybdotransferase MoeA [Gammaproteobacteria bacterium]NND58477.1 molybdopterin molybdotransferase MoeA [Xanthomonadales bacterium]NNK50102.1 molybdopterin molybdotransferase MoeA [Xanthomonadales bacterium]
MLSVEQSISSLMQNSKRLADGETIDLIDACGRTLADSIIAPIDVPPADNSAMDGYALRHADGQNGRVAIPVSQRITAGSVPQGLQPGSAARIFTGAEIPPGADTVVMQEHCEEENNAVRILKLPAAGANIRRRGQDLATGQQVLQRGLRLRSQDLGLAASLGIARVPVYRRLRVAVMSTGDELRDPGDELQPGQIYNSNRFTMRSQLAEWGFDVLDMGVARDDPAAVREVLQESARQADVVITSGGVSVGEEDHVRDVVESLGAIDLWRIAIKPGKPFAFGHIMGKPFIGLPGNPVSVFVTLLVIARPYLFACQGIADPVLAPMRQTARFSHKVSQREDYLRVRASASGLELFPNQSSGVLYSTSWGDGLVRQKAGEEISDGSLVDYFPFALFN